MVMGRNGYGHILSWAEMVMGRNDQLPELYVYACMCLHVCVHAQNKQHELKCRC